MAKHKKLPNLSLWQRILIFGISAIVLVGVLWSQLFMVNQMSQQAQQFYDHLPDVNFGWAAARTASKFNSRDERNQVPMQLWSDASVLSKPRPAMPDESHHMQKDG